MRAGEFTCPSWQAFTPDRLSPCDVTVDSHQAPAVISICLRHSKTALFSQGVTIYLGRTGHTLCPVTTPLGYMAQHGQQPGPLFLSQDGSTLSNKRLLFNVRRALNYHGVDVSGITGHSFRIGVATAAAQAEMEDSLIQTLGCWHLAAFQQYIRMPARLLASTAIRLLHQIPRQPTSSLLEHQPDVPP